MDGEKEAGATTPTKASEPLTHVVGQEASRRFYQHEYAVNHHYPYAKTFTSKGVVLHGVLLPQGCTVTMIGVNKKTGGNWYFARRKFVYPEGGVDIVPHFIEFTPPLEDPQQEVKIICSLLRIS